MPVEQGLELTSLIRWQSRQEVEAPDAAETAETQVRSWATEGKDLITSGADFERTAWSDPDALDFSAFDPLGALLRPEVKVIAVLGKLFTWVSWPMGLEGLSFALADDPKLVPKSSSAWGNFSIGCWSGG